MRTPMVRLLSVAALVAALGAAAHAQGSRTGIIRGLVVDAQRAPVPFATVTLTSPALQGSRIASTREDGSYVFGQLPAGEYDVAFEATRLAPARRQASLRLGSSVDLNVTLGDAAGAPDRNAAASASTARLASPALAAEFYHDEISALPTQRTLGAITRFSPGVSIAPSATDQVVINGGLVLDNLFMMNGVDITDPIAGTPQDLYIEDAIGETAVLTSGLTADYGRFGGGVVNAVTRSGGNRFSGAARANFANPSWSAATPLERCDPAVTVAGCRPAAPRPDTLVMSYEATLGGFIVKNRAWFFGAGKLAEQSTTTVLPLGGVLNTEEIANQRGEIKLTASLARGHTLTFDTAANKTTDDNRPSFAYTADPFAVGKRSIPNYSDVVNYRGALGARTLVEGQASLRRWERRDLASVSAAIVDSPMLARTLTATNGAPVQYNAPYFDVSDPEKRNSIQGTGNVTYFLDTRSAGRHEINGGYEFFRSQHVGGTSQSATGYVFDANFVTQPGSTTPELDANGRFIPLWTPGETLIENWLPTRGATLNVDTQSIFVQDRWAIGDRVSADIGVRQERVRSTATGSFGGVDSVTLTPRLAVGYRVDERGVHTLRASYGEYAGRYDQLAIGRSTAIGNPDLWLGVYFGPVGQGRSFTPGLNPANYLTLGARFPTANVSVADGLLPPLVRELTASYTLQPANGRGLAQLAYVTRDWSRLLEQSIAIANGTTHVVRSGFDVGTFTNVVIRNSDVATRQYSAIEILGEYTLRRDWKVAGNLTAQLTNSGNDPESTTGAVATSALGQYPEIFTADRHFPDGPLPTFERNRLRLWTIYTSRLGPFGAMTLSAMVRAQSGGVYSLAAINQPLTAIQRARLQAAGYPDAPASQTIFFGERGSQTFNGYAVLDLKATYDIPFVKSVRPWAKLELYNALNNQNLIGFDTTVVPDSASPLDSLGLPTGYRPTPSFGKATSTLNFPSPFPGQTGGRTWRAALGFRF